MLTGKVPGQLRKYTVRTEQPADEESQSFHASEHVNIRTGIVNPTYRISFSVKHVLTQYPLFDLQLLNRISFHN